MIAAALLLAAADPPVDWVRIGITDTRLRVFVDRASLHVADDRRTIRIRIGSPGAIAGTIVLVYQDEAIDCRARTWRLTAFDARDADDRTVKSGVATGPALAVVPGTIGDGVVTAVCAMEPT